MRDAAQDTGKSGSSNIRSLFMVMMFVFVAATLISIAGTADDSDAGTTFTVDGINYETITESAVKVTVGSYAGTVAIPASVDNGGKTYNVISIDDYAFYNCTSLISVTIGNNVTSIGNYAFNGSTSLTSVTIPEGVQSIGLYAFKGCTSLTSVTIPNSVTYTGLETFNGCTSLASVTIGSGVKSISYSAFRDCTSLTSVTIPNNVLSISMRAFSGCTSLNSVTIGSGVTSIDWYAFNECKSLTSVTIGSSVASIGDYSFFHCTSLTSVTIPNSVTTIGEYVFSGCTSLFNVSVSSGNAKYCSDNGILFNKAKTTLLQYPAAKTAGSYTIPDSVTTIGTGALSYCTSLTSVTIPNSVTTIGGGAFFHCTSLTKIVIPDSVTSLGWEALHECTSLASVTIGSGITAISAMSFYGCASLVNITVSSDNANYSSENGVLFNKAKTTLVQYPPGKTDVPYTIPNSVTTIADGAFFECTPLTSLFIPDSVTSIGSYVFYECSQLKSLYLQGCKLSSCDTVLDKGLQLISIKEGSSGYSSLLSNYTFCTSDGTEIDRSDLAGYKYEVNSEGKMVRTGSADDPPAPAPSGSNDVILYVVIAGSIIIAIGIIVIVILIIRSRKQKRLYDKYHPHAAEHAVEETIPCEDNNIEDDAVPSDALSERVEQAAAELMSTTLYDIAVSMTDGISITEDEVDELIQKGSFAQTVIGFMYLYGLGEMRQSDEDAFILFKSASEGGQYYTLMALACLYATGRGVEKDIVEAIYWFDESEKISNGHFSIDDHL